VTTITSRGPALIDYLVTLFTANLPGVTVYDGPATTEASPAQVLYVGLSDPDNANGQPAYDSQQQWAALGRRARDEDVTIHCCAEAWSGDDTVKPNRDSCNAILAAVETLLQADATQFGGNVLFPNPGLTNVSAPQNNTSTGGLVRQSFDLVFRCRIGGF
jgi:hypothetical protein